MPVDRQLLLDSLSTVARNRNVMISAQQSAKAGVIAGTSVLVGTLLGGPVGLVLGNFALFKIFPELYQSLTRP